MRRTKVQMTTAALMAAMLLGGCGEAPYELTEAEENIIVNYSAHVVTKYNTYQKEGLTYVLEDSTEEESEAADVAMENVQEETATSTPDVSDAVEDASGAAEDASQPETPSLPTATLTDLFGENGVQVNYVGARLEDSYVEDDYYVMSPDTGKKFLILGIDVANATGVPVDVDYLSKAAEFEVTLNGVNHAKAETSLSLGDFATFDSILADGETRETILLFQVPADVTSIDSVELVVTIGESYQIIL